MITYLNLLDRALNRQYLYTADLETMSGVQHSFFMEGVISGGSGDFTIYPTGGEYETDDSSMAIEVPAGAVPEPVDVDVTQIGHDPSSLVDIVDLQSVLHEEAGSVLLEYLFEPDDQALAEPTTLEMTIDVTGIAEERLGNISIYLYNPGEDRYYELEGVSLTGPYDDGSGNPVMTFTVAIDGLGTYAAIEAMIDEQEPGDTEPPVVNITFPTEGLMVQGLEELLAEITDESAISEAYFTIRAADGGAGADIGLENIPATQTTGDLWNALLDTIALIDGHYLVFATAIDEHGYEGMSSAVNFTIVNQLWMERLPRSKTFRAGRTIPIKFTIKIDPAVDAASPFVRNEELEVLIYDISSNPAELLQTAHFGEGSIDYRIDEADMHYITNFKTSKSPAEYEVEIWQMANDYMIGSFSFETKRK